VCELGICLGLFIGVASILWAKSFKSVACCYVGLFCFVIIFLV